MRPPCGVIGQVMSYLFRPIKLESNTTVPVLNGASSGVSTGNETLEQQLPAPATQQETVPFPNSLEKQTRRTARGPNA